MAPRLRCCLGGLLVALLRRVAVHGCLQTRHPPTVLILLPISCLIGRRSVGLHLTFPLAHPVLQLQAHLRRLGIKPSSALDGASAFDQDALATGALRCAVLCCALHVV